ncbi:tetraspanin-9-like isoform X2 [Parasteatoda tepidariorum]|uniref:tetraspanin-9-like isoform X2 n=1 Tax=Parasteatoda tepidariorum TaxID=114398 RepID=UPI001C71DFDE|nr:tetraspanin-9-like isoform X2 [Parasteatoda tepidariorum]
MFLHRAMRYYRLWIYSCNLVLLVSVVAFVSIAAWIISDFRMSLFPSIDLRHPSLLYGYLALALQGGILQAIGCIGAIRMNERLLNVYWTLMLILLFGDVVLGVVWLFRFHNISSHLREELRTRLTEKFGVDAEFQLLWDRIQTETECCGVDGPQDFIDSEWLKKDRQEYPQHHQMVPRSCCKMQQRSSSYHEPEPLNISCVETDRSPGFIHLTGCYDSVHRWLQHAADLLCVLGFCVIAFLKLCFVGILRYEIREMIQKIRVLRDMSESPGLMDPTGPASLLPGPAMAAKFRRQRSSTVEQKQPPNGNNNDADPVSSPAKKSSSPV